MEGTTASTGGTSSGQAAQANAAGNAAVSNYPGQVASRLRRSLRYPREAQRQGIRGEVHVRFTVNSGGGVGGISIARSSGSPVLDQAAIATVQRAAPFPAIPAAAGRNSWPFTVPLVFSR
jgi:periplasmic protein TonB